MIRVPALKVIDKATIIKTWIGAGTKGRVCGKGGEGEGSLGRDEWEEGKEEECGYRRHFDGNRTNVFPR